MDEKQEYIRIYEGKDTKIENSFGTLYVCGPRTGNTWLKVQGMEEGSRGKTYLVYPSDIRFKLTDR